MAIGRKPAAAKLACCGSHILAPPPMPCRNTTDWRGGAPRPCRSSIMAALTPYDADKPRRHEKQSASPPQSKIVPDVKMSSCCRFCDCHPVPWKIECPSSSGATSGFQARWRNWNACDSDRGVGCRRDLPPRYIDRFGRAGKRCRDCRRGGGNLDGAGRSRLLQDALAPHEI